MISVCFYQVKTVSVRDYDFLKNLSEVKLVQSLKLRISKNFKFVSKFFYKIFSKCQNFPKMTEPMRVESKIKFRFCVKKIISKMNYEWATIRYEKLYIYKQKLLFFINTNIYKK